MQHIKDTKRFKEWQKKKNTSKSFEVQFSGSIIVEADNEELAYENACELLEYAKKEQDAEVIEDFITSICLRASNIKEDK